MTTMRIEIGGATGEQAHEFVAAFQRTREMGLPPQIETEPTVRIAGPWSFHVTTPTMRPDRAAAMMALLAAGPAVA